MKPLRFLMFVAMSTCMLSHSMAQNSPKSSMDALRALLKTGVVTKVQVLRVPDAVMTRVGVTPQALRSIASYTVIFHEDILRTFEPLLSGASVKPEDHTPDLRWGVLFYDAKNNEVGSIFVDKFGQHGFLNGGTVVFDASLPDGNVAKRLRKIIGNLR